jgi:hypothetical protein
MNTTQLTAAEIESAIFTNDERAEMMSPSDPLRAPTANAAETVLVNAFMSPARRNARLSVPNTGLRGIMVMVTK